MLVCVVCVVSVVSVAVIVSSDKKLGVLFNVG